MTILFGWNSYALKSFAPLELGLASVEHADTRIQYRQRYFHIFFIPIIPIGRTWVVKKEGKFYEATPELEQAMSHVRTNWKQSIWAWTGPLLGIAIWIFTSISSNMEERGNQKRVEKNKAALALYFSNDKTTIPLSKKLTRMEDLMDSALSKIKYEDKNIDTSMSSLLDLYFEASLTHKDTLVGYTEDNTFITTNFPGVAGSNEIVPNDYKESLQLGEWKGYYSDTSSVFAEMHKLENYKYILVLKEYNRVSPQVASGGFNSGYSFVKAKLVEIESGKVMKEFKLMSTNSDKVTQFKMDGYSSSRDLLNTLDGDLRYNVKKDASKYVFGKNL